MNGLLPCPFCGSKSVYATSEPENLEYGNGGRFYYVTCSNCHARSGNKYAAEGNDCRLFHAEVRQEWNQRGEDAETVAHDITKEREISNNGRC